MGSRVDTSKGGRSEQPVFQVIANGSSLDVLDAARRFMADADFIESNHNPFAREDKLREQLPAHNERQHDRWNLLALLVTHSIPDTLPYGTHAATEELRRIYDGEVVDFKMGQLRADQREAIALRLASVALVRSRATQFQMRDTVLGAIECIVALRNLDYPTTTLSQERQLRQKVETEAKNTFVDEMRETMRLMDGIYDRDILVIRDHLRASTQVLRLAGLLGRREAWALKRQIKKAGARTST